MTKPNTVVELVYALHEADTDPDCTASAEDAPEDHDEEWAIAGDLIMSLRARGLSIYPTRKSRAKPRTHTQLIGGRVYPVSHDPDQ